MSRTRFRPVSRAALGVAVCAALWGCTTTAPGGVEGGQYATLDQILNTLPQVGTLPSLNPAPPPAEQSLAASCASDAAAAGAMVEAINAARGAEGKTLLASSARLNTAAQTHGCDVARMGRATVAGSNGSNVVDRARAAGYPTCGVVQLVGASESASGMVAGWMGSGPHREQILGQLSDEIGVGAVRDAAGRQWFSVVLGDSC